MNITFLFCMLFTIYLYFSVANIKEILKLQAKSIKGIEVFIFFMHLVCILYLLFYMLYNFDENHLIFYNLNFVTNTLILSGFSAIQILMVSSAPFKK